MLVILSNGNGSSHCIYHIEDNFYQQCHYIWGYLLATFDCLAASNWPPGHPRSDHHVSNPHRPDYF